MKMLIEVDTSDHTNKYTEDVMEVEAYVVGGLEGVFAIYNLPEAPDIYYFASGDDGHWWRISNGLNIYWIPQCLEAFTDLLDDNNGHK